MGASAGSLSNTTCPALPSCMDMSTRSGVRTKQTSQLQELMEARCMPAIREETRVSHKLSPEIVGPSLRTATEILDSAYSKKTKEIQEVILLCAGKCIRTHTHTEESRRACRFVLIVMLLYTYRTMLVLRSTYHVTSGEWLQFFLLQTKSPSLFRPCFSGRVRFFEPALCSLSNDAKY